MASRGAGLGGDARVEVALDRRRGTAAAGAEVDEDVVVDCVGEVGVEEAGDEAGGGYPLKEGDLARLAGWLAKVGGRWGIRERQMSCTPWLSRLR